MALSVKPSKGEELRVKIKTVTGLKKLSTMSL
jgi:hypothetical protein